MLSSIHGVLLVVLALTTSASGFVLGGDPIVVAISTVTSSVATMPSNITFAPPMAIHDHGVPAIGTDEFNCSMKDASGTNVKPSPTRSFVQFDFVAPDSPRFLAFQFDTYAPDGMSNSFWAQFDDGPTLSWNTLKSTSPRPMWMEIGDAAPFDTCFALSPGPHSVRLYGREPGAAVSKLTVFETPPMIVTNASGCQPCAHHSGDTITFTLLNFCGPSLLHPSLIRLNGVACSSLRLLPGDQVVCTAGHIPSTPDNSVTVSLHAYPTDPGVIAGNVALRLTPPRRLAKWAVALIAVACILVVLMIPVPILRPYWANRHAPTDPSALAAVAFCTVPRLDGVMESDAARGTTAQKLFSAVVRDAASRHGVYAARRVGTAELLVARRVVDMCHFAVAVQTRIDALTRDPASPFASDHGSEALLSSVSIHAGFPSILFDDETRKYEYGGSAVEECARLADVARPGQILTSHIIRNVLEREASPLAKDLERYAEIALDDEEAEMEEPCFTLRCDAFRHLEFEAPRSEETSNGRGSMAAQLQQATGNFATKLATVLLVRIVSSSSSRDFTKNFRLATQLVADCAGRHHGVLHAITAEQLVVTFNAKSTAAGHSKKAALAAVAMQQEIAKASKRQVRFVGAMAAGKVTFGDVNGHDIVFGPAVTQACELLDTFIELSTKHVPVSRGALHAQSRSNMEINVVSPDQEQGKQYESDESESSYTSEATRISRNTKETSSTFAATTPLRDASLSFVCDGPLMRDLQHTVDLLILDATHMTDVAAESLLNVTDMPTALTRPTVAIAAIIGPRKMADDEEWQYDLAKADASTDPVTLVNRAFTAAMNGDAATARACIGEIDRTNRAYRSVRIAVAQLVRLLKSNPKHLLDSNNQSVHEDEGFSRADFPGSLS